MQALNRMIQKIGSQLKQLPATSRLLLGALMIILTLSLLLVAQFTGRPALSVLPVDLSDDAVRTRATAFLEHRDIEHQQRGTQIYVPTEDRYTIAAQLLDDDRITSDQIDFSSLLEESSPFLTRDQREQRYLIVRMRVLSSMVSSFKGIQRAKVVIAPSRRGLGRTHSPATASVQVTPLTSPLPQAQVEAIAQLIAGAESGLKPESVRVIDSISGQARSARSADDAAPTRYVEHQLAAEKRIEANIERSLRYIQNVLVTVNAIVDTRTERSVSESYEEPKHGTMRETTDSSTESQRNPASSPGVQPNTGRSIAGAQTGSQSTSESSDSITQPKFPATESLQDDPKGYPLKINAYVGIPRSYYINKYRQDIGDPQAEPDQTTLDTIIINENARIQSDMTPLIDTGSFEDAEVGEVKVSMYPDFNGAEASLGGIELAAPAGGLLTGALENGIVQNVGLGGLAVVSLAMMFLMVRKATIKQELPSPAEAAGVPPALKTDEAAQLVGEAEESAPVLEGVELDDDVLRIQQMLGQINDMVRDTPGDAAGLIRKWSRAEV